MTTEERHAQWHRRHTNDLTLGEGTRCGPITSTEQHGALLALNVRTRIEAAKLRR